MDEGVGTLCVLWAVVVLTVAVVLGSVGSSGAYLSDSDAAGNNSLQGGTLDLKLSELGPTTQPDSTTDETDADSVRDTWDDTSHPTDGSELVNNSLELSNEASTLDADNLNVTVAFAENDSGGTGGNANSTADTIEVASFVYDGTELVGTELTDQDGNGFVDVRDLTDSPNSDNLSSLGSVAAGSAPTIELSLSGQATLLDMVTSGDGLDVELAARVNRVSYVDEDGSSNNTIIYG